MQDEGGQRHLDDKPVQDGDVGGVEDARPFQPPAEQNQQERWGEGGEDGGEEGQNYGVFGRATKPVLTPRSKPAFS